MTLRKSIEQVLRLRGERPPDPPQMPDSVLFGAGRCTVHFVVRRKEYWVNGSEDHCRHLADWLTELHITNAVWERSGTKLRCVHYFKRREKIA